MLHILLQLDSNNQQIKFFVDVKILRKSFLVNHLEGLEKIFDRKWSKKEVIFKELIVKRF